MNDRPVKVLMISHTCQSPVEGQPRVRALLQFPQIELKVVVPDRWFHYGKWRTAKIDSDLANVIEATRIRRPWIPKAQSYLHVYPQLPSIIADFRPDVIDLWEEPWSMVSWQACRAGRRLFPDLKLVCETEQNINKSLPPPFGWFRSWVFQQADFVIGRSQDAVNVAISRGYRGRHCVVPNGVDTNVFSPRDMKDMHHLPHTKSSVSTLSFGSVDAPGLNVGYAGRLVREKGLEDLLNAVARCDESVKLELVGDGPLREELFELAVRLKISHRVRLVGAMNVHDLANWMSLLDVFVLPSRTTTSWKEQFGRVIVEAGACGIPVVASDSGAIPEVVGEGGLVFRERDVDHLAACIERLRAGPNLRRKLGQTGRRQAVERCNWDQVAKSMCDIYLSLAGKGVERVAAGGRL